jgi:hypothetical protein
MSLPVTIQRISDQLSYNLVCAPNYPAEDKTSLDREEQRVNAWLADALRDAARMEDVIGWLQLAEKSVQMAFQHHRNHDETAACKAFENANEYLRNAAKRKLHKIDFVAKFDGGIERAGDRE